MKTIIFITIFVFAVSITYAQEPADALRYSWLTQSGTARNQAIGGASGSLGGEFSTLFTNPAGLGFYKTNELVLTPGYNIQKTNSTYKSGLFKTSNNDFNFGASGFLFSLPYDKKSKFRNYTFAIGVNRAADFNSHIYYKGTNNQSSYSEKYLEELVNNNVSDPNKAATDFAFGSSLAFNTYLIDTTTVNGNFGYKTRANAATGLIQENTVNSSGGITDIALGGAVNLKDKLFFGGTITVPIVNYNRDSHYKETDASADPTNNFNFFEVNETLQTKGVGVNVKAGLIYKPVEYVRLGIAIHSPTFYQLTDDYTAEVLTDLEGYAGTGVKKQTSGDLNDNAPGEIKYNLITPWRVIASASYVFREVENVKRQRAFITADLEYVNYKSASFKDANNDITTKNYFSGLNNAIDLQYKSALNFRIGGELKFNTIMFRLGGAYYGNPYQADKADRVKLSGGLGYRDKGVFVDLTYVYAMNNDVNYPYRLQDKTNDPATVKNNVGNIVATVGFKF
ncbi:MAG: aromatic hydrocarbon degradation protein [Chitinophagaceae bacterium]|nr:aromatic hydrocarbon degradation protein [Chitinophagaceae bacterium]